MKKTIPFQKDFAGILEQRMTAAGIQIKSDKPDDIIIQYITLVKRIIPPKPRKILIAKDFTCPPELQEGWEMFRSKVESGEDINPHQSKTMLYRLDVIIVANSSLPFGCNHSEFWLY